MHAPCICALHVTARIYKKTYGERGGGVEGGARFRPSFIIILSGALKNFRFLLQQQQQLDCLDYIDTQEGRCGVYKYTPYTLRIARIHK